MIAPRAGASNGGHSGTGKVAKASVSVGKVAVSGRAARVKLTCRGRAGERCVVKLTLTTRIPHVSARGRAGYRQLVVAKRAVSLGARRTARFLLRLNAAGARLLLQRRTLTASLVTTQNSARGRAATVATRTVVFHRALN
jgi:hypothetical protein